MAVVDTIVTGLLAFREGLEAILIVVILLLYLRKSQQGFYRKYIFLGVILAIVASLMFSVTLNAFAGGFTGTLEQIFEGATFIISGVFIITLVMWMSREGPKMREALEQRAEQIIDNKKAFSFTGLTFIIILREGVELVLLLAGVAGVGGATTEEIILGANFGLLMAVLFGVLLYFGVRAFNVAKFFKATNVLLILFAAGLITYGLHELIEADIVNPLINEVWNIKAILPETFPDGNPATPEALEIVGAFLKALFGYNANPSLLEIITYPALLAVIGFISVKLWKRSEQTSVTNKPNDYKHPFDNTT